MKSIINNRKKLGYPTLIFIVLFLSTFLYSFLGTSTQPYYENEQEINNNPNYFDQPMSSAFIQTFDYEDFDQIGLETAGYENLTITDVVEGANHFYYTGYVINNTDENHELFIKITTKAGVHVSETFLRNSSSWSSSTGGLAIDVDESNDRLFVAGYMNFYPKGTTSSRFDTYGIGLLACYQISTMNLNWNRTFGDSIGFGFGDGTSSQWDFGGERIEDVLVLPDGNIAITGALYYMDSSISREGVNIFVAKINSNTGNQIWLYDSQNIGPNQDTPIPTYGQKIVLRETVGNDDLFIFGKQRKMVIGGLLDSYYAVESIISRIDESDGTAYVENQLIRINSVAEDPNNSRYRIANDIVLSPDLTKIYACGTYHDQDSSDPNFTDTPLIWELDINNNLQVNQNFDLQFPDYNRTADRIGFDENGTVIISGRVNYNSTPNNYGVWVGNINLEDNYIISSTLDVSGQSYEGLKVAGMVGDLKDSITIVSHFDNSGSIVGRNFNFLPGEPSNIETLSDLDETTTNVIRMEWTQQSTEVNYFYLFRNNTPIEITPNPGDFELIASFEEEYEYLDLNAYNDGEVYYYMLVCGNDRTNSSIVQYTFTTFFDELIAPIPYIYEPNVEPNIFLKNEFITIRWQQIYNAEFYVYRNRSIFTSEDIDTYSLDPHVILDTGSVEFSEQALFLGDFYYLIRAVNASRGDPTDNGQVLNIKVQKIAETPSSIAFDNIDNVDGKFDITFMPVPETIYYAYGKIGEEFTYEDLLNEEDGIYFLGSRKAIGSYGYVPCSVPLIGNWFVTIFASNSTGPAEEISQFINRTIGIVPAQPNIYLSTKNPHNTSLVIIEWDEVPFAEYYVVYRVSGEFDGARNNLANEDIRKQVYNGTALRYTDNSEKEDGLLYFYTVVAVNQYGERAVDILNPGKTTFAKMEFSGMGLNIQMLGIIIGGSVIVAVGIGWYFYKKRRPWAGY